MPQAPKLEAPQGLPLFDVQFRALSEALAGDGVASAADLEVTATANALELQVAAGTAVVGGTEYQLSAAETVTLSQGDADHDRWDTVVLDTSGPTAAVSEGTPAQYPTPPDVSDGELLLAVVYVPQGATDVPGSDVLGWRTLPGGGSADRVRLADSDSLYSSTTVDGALGEVVRQAGGDPLESALGATALGESLGSLLSSSASGGTNQSITLTDYTTSGGETVACYPMMVNGERPPMQIQIAGDGSGNVDTSFFYWYGDECEIYGGPTVYGGATLYDPTEIHGELTLYGVTTVSNNIRPDGLGGVFEPPDDPGDRAFGLADFQVSSSSSSNSYDLRVGGAPIVEMVGVGDGSGGWAERYASIAGGSLKAPLVGPVELTKDLQDDNGVTYVDYSAGAVRNLESHAADHEAGGADEVAHNNLSISADDHHAPPTVVTDAQSGDGSTATFTISHGLGAVPSGATVQPTSEDASARHWRSGLTDTAVEVTYSTAPPSGTDNLSWEVTIQP